MAETYRIVRMFQSGKRRAVRGKSGLTLEQAREYCSDRQTSSSTATTAANRRYTRLHGPWFDGYEKE